MNDFSRIVIENQNPVQTEAMVWVEFFKVTSAVLLQEKTARQTDLEYASEWADVMMIEFHKRFHYVRDIGRYVRRYHDPNA